MNKLIVLSTLIASISLCTPALAWNKAGHMVSGAIAYTELKNKAPQSLPKVIALLKKHPDYAIEWQTQLSNVPQADRDLYLFMLAARWSDDARKTTEDRPSWHYVNLPFKLGATVTTIPASPTGEENILTALAQNRTLLAAPGTTPTKAIALTWIFHLTGDIHQPLHTTKAVSTQFPLPEGDRGGTRFYIRAKEGSSTISLHKYWDDLILGSDRFQSVRNQAISLRQNTDYQRTNFPEITETSFDKWGKESYKLAPSVYENVQSGTKTNGKALPDGYADTAKTIAQRRLVLAGYRLADYLKSAF
ncbi:S1/P1 nuclease [Chamaesiphon minutus]|uniref:S1/P1 Nuclease n=1 Tax=Chamaesiphon minutus (strain ATCC 27169 / PCC 6605) TaxID=1173020 RepID=K9UEM3_CHAP6|nr:S1/P1 nuclease [Chamaesiphon minutus]AFY93103.1 S1/P1 Nuclease [Chamaesiphon minutus PCC 6605]